MTDEELLRAAANARRNAHVPYSRFAVGAAALAGSGKVYTGVNIENASYGLTVCAERVAVWKAVSEGEREIVALAVVTANSVTPCGACRQVLAEFAPKIGGLEGLRMIVADAQGHFRVYTLHDLLPEAFIPAHLPSGSGTV